MAGGQSVRRSEKAVRESLLKQLSETGATADHYVDLIGDYIRWWRIHREFLEDIRQRGAVEWRTLSTGAERREPNPSVKSAREASQHMLAILRELGLSPGHGADVEPPLGDL